MRARLAWLFDRKTRSAIADYLVVALAVALPLSTSLVSILVVIWLLVLLPLLDLAGVRRTVTSPAGALPLLLIAAALVGMLWSPVPWPARFEGLVSFLKLLAIPLLFVQFSRSARAPLFVNAFIAGSVALLLLSFLGFWLGPSGWYPFPQKVWGIPVRDYISQSGFFTASIFLLLDRAAGLWHERRYAGFALAVGLAVAFAINMAVVAISRTTLMVMPILLLLFIARRINWKAGVLVLVAAVVFSAVAWTGSSYLRQRADSIVTQFNDWRAGENSSVGERLQFYRASFAIIAHAPLVGHGTGSIHAMFERYAPEGSVAQKTTNPHNQTFAVGIQLGLLGIVLLYAMWLAHVVLFRGGGAMAWFGLVIVVQNVVSSLVNTHLFDFAQGWTYAMCVGVAGGAVLAERRSGDAPQESVPPAQHAVAPGQISGP